MKNVLFRKLYAKAEEWSAPPAILTHHSYPFRYQNHLVGGPGTLMVVDAWHKHHLRIDLWIVIFTVEWESFHKAPPTPYTCGCALPGQAAVMHVSWCPLNK